MHLDDLCASDPLLMACINQILQTKVYPLVRAAFTELGSSDGDDQPLGPLCVYDSIFVRYNGDKAKEAGRIGASQPLVSAAPLAFRFFCVLLMTVRHTLLQHQDGGIYSVNIALNNERSEDANDIGFAGGKSSHGVGCIRCHSCT